ncbi:MAG: hypothetical protein PWQ63_1623 [Methanolobus sp.]|jgi:hypothetical protein|nr:hypothetical protein [Methanolobus sp.]MDK2948463.1 hypothetical protein [Methanolobus sp.]
MNDSGNLIAAKALILAILYIALLFGIVIFAGVTNI